MNRKEKRSESPEVLKIREAHEHLNTILKSSGGGYGLGMPNSKPASGQSPQVNPFIQPKASGLNVISQTFLNQYYVEWNLSTWRSACDQAIKMGYPISYAVLTSWAFESSPFIQSLFRELKISISKIPIQFQDDKGNVIDELNKEITQKMWFQNLLEEVISSNFWGFSGVNFDPLGEKIYKYQMQDIDPINRLLKSGTFLYYDGQRFDDNINLLYFQPSTNYESFLGWMQPITRSFIQINQNNNNWMAAGMRLAFPLLTIGYPQDDNSLDIDGQTVINPYRLQAESLAENIDPSKALVYPYTLDMNGNISKAMQINQEGGVRANGMQSVYSDFNEIQKDEIRQMILLSTLTSSQGTGGSYALAKVHENKYNSVIEYTIDRAVSMLNDEFLRKIPYFYKGFPIGKVKLAADKSKQWDIEEVKTLSDILKLSGKKLSTVFFEKIGLAPEDIEIDLIPEKENNFEEPEIKLASENNKTTLFSSVLKKKL